MEQLPLPGRAAGGTPSSRKRPAPGPGRRRTRARRRGRYARVRRPHRNDSAATLPGAASPRFDRVCGGRLVVGSALLIGGDQHRQVDPAASGRGGAGAPAHRLRLHLGRRGARSGAAARNVWASVTRRCSRRRRQVRDIVATLGRPRRAQGGGDRIPSRPCGSAVDSTPGTVTQVRAPAQAWSNSPSAAASPFCWSGHVTKDSAIAGPRARAHGRHGALFRGRADHQFHACAPSRTASARPTRSACSRCPTAACRTWPTLRRCSWATAAAASRAPACSRVSNARPLLVKIQALVALLCHAAPRRGRPGYQPPRHGAGRTPDPRAASPSAPTTSINVAGSLRISRRPPTLRRRPSYRRWPTRRCQPTWWCSARSDWAAEVRPGRKPARGAVARGLAKLGFRGAPWCRAATPVSGPISSARPGGHRH